MAGETIAFSQADLAATAAAFNPAVGKAPIVVGHPATDDPAQGWIERLEANGRGLFAYPKQVDPAFAEAARAGRYGTLSAMFYRPTDPANPVPGVWYLKHVGALGGQQPAVKGLDDPAFAAHAAGPGVCFAEGVAFSAWEDRTNSRLWRGLRDFLIGKFGQEQADAVVPSYQVEILEQAAHEDAAEEEVAQPAGDAASTSTPAPAFAEPTPSTTPESTVSLAEKAAIEAENARLKAQLAQIQAAQAQAQAEKRHAANVAFCEALAADARLKPASLAMAVATLDHLAAQPGEVAFGEGDAKTTLFEGFKAYLAAQPAQVSFAEAATHGRAAGEPEGAVAFAAPDGFGVDPLAMALHAKALAHQKAHPGTPYTDAVQAVS